MNTVTDPFHLVKRYRRHGNRRPRPKRITERKVKEPVHGRAEN